MRNLLACLAGAALAGCGGSAPDVTSAPAPSADAIGVLTGVHPDGSRANLCTATLIGPHTVLAAKHCAETSSGPVLDKAPFFFEIGPDSAQPTRSIRAVAATGAPRADGGLFARGSDVAVFQLAEDVGDLVPYPVSDRVVGAADVGAVFTAVGYGIREPGQTVNDLLTRRQGGVTLQALTGHPLHVLFASSDALLAYVASVEGAAFVTASGSTFVDSYDNPAGALLDGYEAYLGMGAGDLQVCNLDSGGPMLRDVDGRPTLFGVSSRTWTGKPVPCLLGGVYALLGQPDNAQLLATALADECRGVPTAGACVFHTLARCTPPEEGPRRVVLTECPAACDATGGAPACR